MVMAFTRKRIRYGPDLAKHGIVHLESAEDRPTSIVPGVDSIGMADA
jgi:hypothetical protein